MDDPKKEMQITEAVQKVSRAGSRVTMTLSAIAGGLAVALLIACIGGGLYIGQLQRTIEDQNEQIYEDKYDTSSGDTYIITYKYGDETENDECTIDKSRETEMIIKKDEDGDIMSVAVADFKKGVYGMYFPRKEECYITSELNAWATNISADAEMYDANNGEVVKVDNNSRSLSFKRASNIAVKDHSILPRELQKFCRGKPLYWIDQANEDENNTEDVTELRRKRACYSCRVCGPWQYTSWGRWRVCVNGICCF